MNGNPFYISAKIPDEYFCDRKEDSEKLIKYIVNGNNVVLISPRRMGKSGLIHHCYQKKELKSNFELIYLDILQTSSLQEFVYLFGKTVYDSLVPKTKKWITKFFQTLKSISAQVTFDTVTGYPSFSFMLREIKFPLITLEEIFKFIEDYPKKCLIAIDEFQQITRYPEKNLEALLRTYIQQQNNVRYIFSGSQRHIMQEMFLSYSRPFYQSSTIMVLEPIPMSVYVDFAANLFYKKRLRVENSAIEKLYRLFDGLTFYMQKTLNEVYSSLSQGEVCNEITIEKAIIYIVEQNALTYREILSNIPVRQKELLYAIAFAGVAENICSAEFINKYSLVSASSIQSATKQLLEKDYITKIEGKYSLPDKFFALWIRMTYGPTLQLF